MHAPQIDLAVEAGAWPSEPALRQLAGRAVAAAFAVLAELRAAAAERAAGGELSLLFTDDAAMRRLNRQWRDQDRPTNVLSFPQAAGPLLGDVILAAETVAREATLAEKPLEDHMAHLIVHGFLHLLGYDHETEAEAEAMEELERAALQRLGIADPYAAPQAQ